MSSSNARTRLPFRLFLCALASIFLSNCGTNSPTINVPRAEATPRPAPTTKAPATPPPIPSDAATETGTGSFDQFKFTFRKTGQEVAADFAPRGLPRMNQNTVVAAARAVILAAYGERMENFPRLVRWEYKEHKHAIKLEGERFDYIFVPITEEDKDIRRMIFWRVEKGTVE